MDASPLVSISLAALSIVVGAAFVAAVRSVSPEDLRRAASGVALWMAGTAGLALAGVLSFETVPPTLPVLLAILTGGTVLFSRSRLGERLSMQLSLAVLVSYQGFRILVELWLHRAYVEGVMPVQMTYAGLNFDIVTGVSAVAVGILAHRGMVGRRVVLAWNVVGLALLATVVTVALLSAPLPFRVFREGPGPLFVTGFPGVWLPTVLVQAALLGHLLVFRNLFSTTGRGIRSHVASGAPEA